MTDKLREALEEVSKWFSEIPPCEWRVPDGLWTKVDEALALPPSSLERELADARRIEENTQRLVDAASTDLYDTRRELAEWKNRAKEASEYGASMLVSAMDRTTERDEARKEAAQHLDDVMTLGPMCAMEMNRANRAEARVKDLEAKLAEAQSYGIVARCAQAEAKLAALSAKPEDPYKCADCGSDNCYRNPAEAKDEPVEKPLVPCCLCPDQHYPECPRGKPSAEPKP